MASGKRDGPDLVNEGVALHDLADGALLKGRAGEDSVLLARVDGEVFAVGAKCTHYGGPLDKGLVVEHTVRCPWHHAAFSLRTGEALRAPALDPLPCWTVEVRDGRAFVGEKAQREPLEPTPHDLSANRASPEAIVIVGAGAAGSAATEMLRRCGYAGPITLIDGEERAPYDRPNLSKDYLAGNAPESWLPLRPDGFYEQHGVTVVRERVSALDTAARTVRLESGASHRYDALLLATGSEARALDIPGHDLPHVFTLRSWADSRAIIARAEQSRRAVVVGASFIGLEVAASLRARGLEVRVVAPEERPLLKVFGPDLGAMIQSIHEEHGVAFHLGQKPERIDEDGVTLEGGERLAAELVVVGIGVRPRLELAAEAGLEVERGIMVDEYLETSAPGVYAAGDIARWPDARGGAPIRVEHWVVAQRQGQAAARNMLGAREPFTAAPFFWSKHYDLSIRYSGHAEEWDEIAIDGSLEQRTFSAAFRRNGRTLAVASGRRDRQNLEAAAALERGDEAALRRLVAT